MKFGGGVDEFSLRFIVFLLHGLLCVISVMSDFSLDDLGFKAPGVPPPAPPSSDSSSETPPDGRRTCIACPKRMSKKTVDRHISCVSCRGFDCDIDTRCEECMDWPEEEVRLYAKYRKPLKSKTSTKSKSSAPLPPPADSIPSPQPSPRGDIEHRLDSLSVTVTNLAELVHTKLEALTASLCSPPLTQLSSQPRLGPDVREPQPGVTAGFLRKFQALGVPDGTPAVPLTESPPVGQGVRAPSMGQSGSASAPPPPLEASAPHPPPPRFEVPPSQPSTSGWVPSGPPPSRSAYDSRTSSESEASDAESDALVRDSASSRLADLIYEVCPESRPPRCGFEAWFGQPESSASKQHFRLYPRVVEVESEVYACAEARSAHQASFSYLTSLVASVCGPLFASSLPVNPSFVQLAGTRAVGSKRWGSISFSEMERVFRNQLEMTSSSLWLMSGILAMLKRDSFQPSDPTLFNAALSSVSAAMSRQARSAAAGSTFLRFKRRDSLLSHTSVPVPEAQRRSLATTPGSGTGLFDESLLGDVVAQVQRSSVISSNLAVSRSFGRSKSSNASSSPLVDPSSSGPHRAGRSYGKRSASSSRSRGRKRFRGGKGSAPSSKPSGFQK